MKVGNFLQQLYSLCLKYGLEIFSLDYTDITVFSRIGYSSDVFIQVYLNSKKEKLNLALVISKNRIYGVDKEGGIYHEHPLDNPETHIPLQKGISLEEFILKSIDILKNLGIL